MQIAKTDKRFFSLKKFLAMEASGGILLMLSAIFAIAFVNIGFSDLYHDFLALHVSIKVGDLGLDKSLHHWINDGLMAIFFLLVGLEIKREILEGELATIGQAALPVVAAIGGMLVPALIYLWFNQGDEVAAHGWAIPSATDIAFALGILALFGSRVPIGLKIFLTAVAVIDDLGAIIIIALFYTDHLTLRAIAIAGVCLLVLLGLNLRGVNRTSVFVVVGFIMWFAVLKSGVHATLAGVALGLLIPHKIKDEHGHSMLAAMEHNLHSWVAYAVLPLFAFANAGIDFAGMSVATLHEPIPLGIALGLFIGKQIGVFSFSFLMIKLGFAKLPTGANWLQFYAVCLLCGVGFTMSLFIGTLAFTDEAARVATRLGVIGGSILSGSVAYLMLSYCLPKAKPEKS